MFFSIAKSGNLTFVPSLTSTIQNSGSQPSFKLESPGELKLITKTFLQDHTSQRTGYECCLKALILMCSHG